MRVFLERQEEEDYHDEQIVDNLSKYYGIVKIVWQNVYLRTFYHLIENKH